MIVVPFIMLNSMSSTVVDKFNWLPATRRDQSSVTSQAACRRDPHYRHLACLRTTSYLIYELRMGPLINEIRIGALKYFTLKLSLIG